MPWDGDDVLKYTVTDFRNRPQAEVEMDRWNAESLAVGAGIARELIICPNHLTPQGIERIAKVPGTPRDFNAGSAVLLRCGCWLV